MRLVDREELPADAGLSALGVLMRLGGSLGLWAMVYGLIPLLVGRAPLSMVGLVLFGAARSYLHGRAGRALAAASPGADRQAFLYVGVAVAHTLLIFLFLGSLPEAPGGVVTLLIALSLTWPVVVAGLLLRPQARAVSDFMRTQRRRIFAEDLSMTGMAALMAAMGSVGFMVLATIITMGMFAFDGAMRPMMMSWLPLLLLAGFTLRSFLHAHAGIGLLRRFEVHTFRNRVGNYGVVALITSAAVGLLSLMGAARGGMLAVLMVVPLVGLLMAWPLILRDAGTVELRSDLEEGDPPPVRPARDQGLVMLGIVLLAVGLFSVCYTAVLSTVDLSALTSLANTPVAGLPSHALWQSLVLASASVWAGVELVGMTSRRKAAAVANLGLLVAISVLNFIEFVQAPPEAGPAGAQEGMTMMFVVLAMLAPLAIPAVAVVQALRKPASTERRLDEVF